MYLIKILKKKIILIWIMIMIISYWVILIIIQHINKKNKYSLIQIKN